MKHTTYTRPKTLLTTNNKKTVKGEKLGVKTYILYMAPYNSNSKGANVCSHASPGCVKSCLFGSGFGGMFTRVADARRNRTEYFLADRAAFFEQLDKEIFAAIRRAKGRYKLAFRLNGTSDIRYEKFKIREGKNIFELYPQVTFYDYTKNYLRFDNPLPKNYHLTFSRSETNEETALQLLERGVSVAMVFRKVPKEYKGFKVVDGDKNDLRFKDKKGVIVGLKYKKMTGKNGKVNNIAAVTSGFVIGEPKVSPVKVSLRVAA